MENRKDIGKAFKEKLRDFDRSPDDKLWAAIEADLDKKKKRRAFPFWWTFLAVGVTLGVGYLIYNGSVGSGNSVPPDMGIIHSGSASGDNQNAGANIDSNQVNNGKDAAVGDVVVNGTSGSNIDNNAEADKPKGEHSSANDNAIGSQPKNKFSNQPNNNLSGSGNRTSMSQPNSKNQRYASGKRKPKRIGTGKDQNGDENAKDIAAGNPKNNTNSFPGTVNQIEKDNNPGLLIAPETGIGDTKSQTTTNTDKTEEQPIPTPIKKDSLKTKPVVKKETPKDSAKTQKKDWEKLNLFAYVSPIYSRQTKRYSPIDRILHNSKVSSEITMGYGAYVSYAASENWSARIGVALIKSRYITHDKDSLWNQIDYSGINYTKNIYNATIHSLSPNSRSLDIIQDISYIEVPIELKYAISNRKFGVNAYGGLSISFLGKNKVTIATPDGQRFDVGETKGLSTNAFSINAGLGFDYKLSRRVKINLEPIFKYHLLDYTNMPNVKPYTFSVLTGLQFSL